MTLYCIVDFNVGSCRLKTAVATSEATSGGGRYFGLGGLGWLRMCAARKDLATRMHGLGASVTPAGNFFGLEPLRLILEPVQQL